MSDTTLFDLPVGTAVVTEPTDKLSATRRRTQLQRQRLANGLHPLAGVIAGNLKLHPDAPPYDDRTAPGPRCGSCWYRVPTWTNGNRQWAKCHFGAQNATDARPRELPPPRVSHSAASDVRAWWPACTDYSPGDQRVSPDAARYIPDGG